MTQTELAQWVPPKRSSSLTEYIQYALGEVDRVHMVALQRGIADANHYREQQRFLKEVLRVGAVSWVQHVGYVFEEKHGRMIVTKDVIAVRKDVQG